MPYFTEAMIEACFTDVSNPVDDRNGRLAPDLVFWDDQRPRYAHIDLGISHDAAGLCVSHLKKMERVPFGESRKYGVEFLPFVGVDLIAGFSPILFKKKKVQIKYIIGILLELVQRRGMNLELVTADGYQSAIIFETMEDEGINCGHLSIDNTTTYPVVDGGKVKRVSTQKNGAAAVDCLFTLVDDRRFECPRYDQLSKEGPNLERDEEQSLVYKIPGSTDDVIQAASGAVFNVVNNAREANVEDFVDEKKPQKISEAFPDEQHQDDDDSDFVNRSLKIVAD